MNTPDLDQLRQRWQQAQHAAEAQLSLDIQALRRGALRHSQQAFGQHSRWLLLGLVGQVGVLALLLGFLVGHWQDSIYRLLAAPMMLLMLAQVVVSATQWWVLRRLDLSASVLSVRNQLDRLRSRQLAVTRWIILSSVLLWLPMLLVLVKGVAGVDLLDHLHPSVVWVNFGLGLGFLLLGDWLLRGLARRYAGSATLQRWQREMAGRSWQRAEQSFDALDSLEHSLNEQAPAEVLARQRRRATRLQQFGAPLAALRRRLLLVACVYAAGMLAVGLFNMMHGGQVAFILPGVLLNAFFITQMAVAIAHRAGLARLDFSADAPALNARLAQLAHTQLRVARINLRLSPLFGLLLLQVLAKATLGISLMAALPPALLGVVLALAALALILLLRARADGVLTSLARYLLLGCAERSERLQRALV